MVDIRESPVIIARFILKLNIILGFSLCFFLKIFAALEKIGVLPRVTPKNRETLIHFVYCFPKQKMVLYITNTFVHRKRTEFQCKIWRDFYGKSV